MCTAVRGSNDETKESRDPRVYVYRSAPEVYISLMYHVSSVLKRHHTTETVQHLDQTFYASTRPIPTLKSHEDAPLGYIGNYSMPPRLTLYQYILSLPICKASPKLEHQSAASNHPLKRVLQQKRSPSIQSMPSDLREQLSHR